MGFKKSVGWGNRSQSRIWAWESAPKHKAGGGGGGKKGCFSVLVLFAIMGISLTELVTKII